MPDAFHPLHDIHFLSLSGATSNKRTLRECHCAECAGETDCMKKKNHEAEALLASYTLEGAEQEGVE